MSPVPLPTSPRPSSGNLESMQLISKSLEEKRRNKTIKTIQCLVKILVAILAIEVAGTIAAFFISGTPAICLIILGGLVLATVLCVILLSIKIALLTKPQAKDAEQQVKRKLSSQKAN
ncbi:hypothetical protein [Candidatus Chlamydia corallus]|uniref:hypothetical protein n=1 Tax=Candidatus Chlamydia corallus TaxID=2038470 RepID=UPI001EFDCF0B|nr:hypothetical protein [Candidatus Chlamydia corallus]